MVEHTSLTKGANIQVEHLFVASGQGFAQISYVISHFDSLRGFSNSVLVQQ